MNFVDVHSFKAINSTCKKFKANSCQVVETRDSTLESTCKADNAYLIPIDLS
jgi:hypothetical protein